MESVMSKTKLKTGSRTVGAAVVSAVALAALSGLASVGGGPGGAVAAAQEPPKWCGGAPATIIGTPGDDVLVGTEAHDRIVGLGGNDVIRGAGGSDSLCGGDGSDLLDGAEGSDNLYGGAGRDRLIGGPASTGYWIGNEFIPGPGNDIIEPGPVAANRELIRYDFFSRDIDQPASVDVDLEKLQIKTQGQGTDTLVSADRLMVFGTDGDDTFIGNDASNIFWPFGGYDTADAGGGDDVIFDFVGDPKSRPREVFDGGDGDDRIDVRGASEIHAGAGDDIVESHKGPNPLVYGDGGDDDIELGEHGGIPRIYGGSGDDRVFMHAGRAFVWGGGGDDQIRTKNIRGRPVLWHDQVVGGPGDDLIETDRGDDAIAGGPGVDGGDAGPGTDTCVTTEEVVGCER